ncbi:MAG: hypothetical protein LAT82_00455 [Nanoarchaeota archaeon]|nr:hypothetical protein [Nanoarchaeota archaeon]
MKSNITIIFKKINKYFQINNLNSKKGELLTPIDIFSIILVGLLIVLLFIFAQTYPTGNNNNEINLLMSDEELFKTSTHINELGQNFQITDLNKASFQSVCNQIFPSSIEEVFFVEKHCSNKDNYYRLVQNEVISSLRRNFRENSNLQLYMNTLKDKIGLCQEFGTTTDTRISSAYLNLGSAIIPIPSNQFRSNTKYIVICSREVDLTTDFGIAP